MWLSAALLLLLQLLELFVALGNVLVVVRDEDETCKVFTDETASSAPVDAEEAGELFCLPGLC
jgi:hypothetical protein